MTQHTSRFTRAQLFVTCLVDTFFPSVGNAVVNVLANQGVKSRVPDKHTCCGQPAFNAGLWNDARAMARHTIDIFSDDESPVVVPSGSCADMVVHQYPVLLKDDLYLKKAENLANRTFEFSQFLVDKLDVDDVGAQCGGCVAYHACCHGLRGLGIDPQPKKLLKHIKGITQRSLSDAESCCGFGGLFAIKMSDISGAILQRKLDDIEASGANIIVATDVSCLMHIEGGLRRRDKRIRTMHLAEILASSSDNQSCEARTELKDRTVT